MRTIQVTGGFADYAVGVLEEVNAEPLTLTQIRVALVPDGGALPARNASTWVDPGKVEFLSPHIARVSMLVTDAVVPGSYWLWALAADNPTAIPVKAGNHMIVVL